MPQPPETRGVRWNPATEAFEMWCPHCTKRGEPTTYWPITLEFWSPGNTQRCRACNAEIHRKTERERHRKTPEKALARNRAYYWANHDVLRAKDNERRRRQRAEMASAQGIRHEQQGKEAGG